MNKLTAALTLRILFYFILVIILIFAVYPIFWVIMSSLKTPNELSGGASYAFPLSLYTGNYFRAIQNSNLLRYFFNSTIVAVCTLAGIVVLGCPAAFAISKIQFKSAGKILIFFLFGMMVPTFATLIPMFKIYNVLGLRNTYLSLVLPQVGFSLPICIYLYTGFFNFMSNSILEAAIIDGAGSLRAFASVAVPLVKNTTITILTFNFVNIWNEFTFSNTFMTDNLMKTLPVGLNDFVGEMGVTDWGATFAAITIAILPTLVIYFILNRNVMEGMTAGAVKS